MKPWLLPVLLCAIGAARLPAAPVKVELQHAPDGSWQLLRGGQPYQIKGAGGVDHFDALVAAGGNSVRTWGEDQIDKVIGPAHEHDLTVLAGLWVMQQRQGADYTDPARAAAEVERHKAAVLRYKDDPAILMWAVGNELEMPHADPAVWDVVESLARWIKSVDPNHPVMTVTAFADAETLAQIRKRAPDIDVLGVNAYGAAPKVREHVAQYWGGPYVVTEWGPNGQWESPKTRWGTVIEPSSTEKARTYAARYPMFAGSPACLGSYAFWWGQRNEATLTWFGMFLRDGSPLGSVDAMQHAWTGEWPAHRAPEIRGFTLHGGHAGDSVELQPGQDVEADVAIDAPGGDTFDVRWELTRDEHRPPQGGDPEPPPEVVPMVVHGDAGPTIRFTAPTGSGAYRLYFYATTAHGRAATANFPFFVEAKKPAAQP